MNAQLRCVCVCSCDGANITLLRTGWHEGRDGQGDAHSMHVNAERRGVISHGARPHGTPSAKDFRHELRELAPRRLQCPPDLLVMVSSNNAVLTIANKVAEKPTNLRKRHAEALGVENGGA